MNAILKTLCTVVGVPTLIATLYFGLFASDIYVSEAKCAIRSAKGSADVGGLGALLASPVIATGGQDASVVMDYTQSLDMLTALQKQIDVVSHYSDDQHDFLSRLQHEHTQDELLDYFVKHVEIDRELASDVISLKVRAFDAQMAQSIAVLIIELNETLINELSNRIEGDALESARSEMDRAVHRVRSTAQDINQFQTENDSLSPAEESTALFGRISEIEGRLSESRAAMSEMLAFMREDSADVRTLGNRVNALERQLQIERGKVTSGQSGTLGSLLESYQPLVLEQQIAQQQYASALASFELARIEVQRKKQYMVTFVDPSLPDAASEPQRFIKIITVMVFSFLAYLIGGLLWSALKDHMGH